MEKPCWARMEKPSQHVGQDWNRYSTCGSSWRARQTQYLMTFPWHTYHKICLGSIILARNSEEAQYQNVNTCFFLAWLCSVKVPEVDNETFVRWAGRLFRKMPLKFVFQWKFHSMMGKGTNITCESQPLSWPPLGRSHTGLVSNSTSIKSNQLSILTSQRLFETLCPFLSFLTASIELPIINVSMSSVFHEVLLYLVWSFQA